MVTNIRILDHKSTFFSNTVDRSFVNTVCSNRQLQWVAKSPRVEVIKHWLYINFSIQLIFVNFFFFEQCVLNAGKIMENTRAQGVGELDLFRFPIETVRGSFKSLSAPLWSQLADRGRGGVRDFAPSSRSAIPAGPEWPVTGEVNKYRAARVRRRGWLRFFARFNRNSDEYSNSDFNHREQSLQIL